MSNLVQKAALEQLLSQVKSKIKLLRRAENGRKKSWKFKKAQAAFRSNPYRAGKSLLDPKCSSTTLQVEQSVLDSHKSSSVSDKFFDIPLCALEGLPESPSISKPFSLVALKYEDFVSILNTRRNASAPGYNVIPYKVYKKCTKINSFLFNVFKSCVKNCVIPIQWRYAKEIYIPKSKTPSESNIKDFRPIALLNVEPYIQAFRSPFNCK